MDPLSTTITYVSLKFIDQFIKDEGYGRLKKILFPTQSYRNRVFDIICETITEFEKQKPLDNTTKQFPFYHSQILFDTLNTYILFNNSQIDYTYIIESFKTNNNIIIPTISELEDFYNIFTEKIKNDKKAKKLFIEEKYKSKIFDLAESLNSIERTVDTIRLTVQSIHDVTTFQPDQNWFIQQCKSSIDNLGKRYSPEINVKLELSEIFEGLGRTEEFKKKVTKQLDLFVIKGKKVIKGRFEVKENLERLENVLNEIQSLFHNTDFLGTTPIPILTFEDLLNKSQHFVQEIYDYCITEEHKLQKEKNVYRYYHKYGSELRNIEDFEHEYSSFRSLIQGISFELANNPFLLLDGDAGIGKSHLIGDIVARRIIKEHESVFLLGQHFVTEEDPWTQIFKRLQINTNSVDFLRKLNQRAEVSGKRIIIFIDAINEGKGNYFWNDSLKSFINEIKKYEWLGLVLTVRTSYKKLIFPEEEISSLNIVEHHHFGFRNIEFEASKLFFDNYKIELPNVPLLHPEFQNPLFLKLFCEGINKAGLTRIPDGLQGITSIINFFLKNINIVLSKPKRIGYSDSLNLVKKSISALIKYKVQYQLRYIPYEKAHEVVNDSISSFISTKGFIDELISEGVLSKNLFWNEGDDYEEGIYLAYERFEDHLIVQYLLEQYPALEKEFKEDGKLYKYVENEAAIYRYKGLIEAFSIQVPELKGYEFYNLVPDLKDRYPIVESFIESLLWRKVNTINKESIAYVNECALASHETHDYFWEIIIAVTGIPNHSFNAHFLHNHLMKFSLPKRDSNWTQLLIYKYSDESSVKRLIDWAWSQTDKSHISDESVLLSSITLAWFHTSTNRQLRDCSTKALICLLQNRLEVLLELLKMFKEVNDPYVSERLYAVAYGCVLRTNQREKIIELSAYIFKTIFENPSEVIPHILLRDYARGVIEYAHYLGLESNIELSKVRPPYESNWPESIPTEEELKEKYDNEDYREIWTSTMWGDFASYTIGTNSVLSEWTSYKKGQIPVDPSTVFKRFIDKLNPEQSALLQSFASLNIADEQKEVDLSISFSLEFIEENNDELNLKRDLFKKSLDPELLSEYENKIESFLDNNYRIKDTLQYFDLRIAQRLILTRVMELGWNPKLHLLFDREIGTGRGRPTTPNERIGKKYQWIAYYEYMSLLSDNFIKRDSFSNSFENQFQGPWDPYVRDIDPTILISKTEENDDNDQLQDFWWLKNQIFNWECTNESWVQDSSTLPKMEEIIQIKDDKNEEWLLLEGYPYWGEPKKIGEEKWNQPRKELWCQVRSYLVKDEEFLSFRDWAINQNFMGRWMPESRDRYEMFSREYYWSPANDYFKSEYYGGDWREVYDRLSGKLIARVNVTAQGYLWEEEFDKSKENTISYLVPSTVIYNIMDLNYGQKEGEFIDKSKQVQCFAANVYNNSKSYLLVRRNSFLKLLNDNGLKIVWTILGEKQIIGSLSFQGGYHQRLEISGAYYFENEKLVGNIKTNNT